MAFQSSLKAATTCQAAVRCSSRAVPVMLAPCPVVAAAPSFLPPLPASCAPSPAQNRRNVACNVVIKSRVERTDDEIQEILYTTEQLNEVLDEMGRQIGHDYQNKDLLVLGVLKGGFVFTADLVRHIHPVPATLEVDFFKASSYGSGLQSSGQVKLDCGFNLASVKDKHVLVAEDIIDSGLTMSKIVSVLRAAGAMSVRVAVLLDKRTRRQVTFDADYVGIVCPDEFVVGYGIDFAERYRWLPYIGVPKPEVIEAILAKKKEQEASSRSDSANSQHNQAALQATNISSDARGPVKPASHSSTNQKTAVAAAAPVQGHTNKLTNDNGVLGFKGFGNHIQSSSVLVGNKQA